MVVLWNHERCSVQATFSIQSSDQPQEVESLSWHADGTKFISAHGDGSLTRWSLEGSLEIPKAVTPLGPFPCKAITKVEWSDSSVFFSGGMPRASYGDRHCVSLIQDANLVEGGDNTPQVAFDFTSRVMDFFTVKANGAGKLKKEAFLHFQCLLFWLEGAQWLQPNHQFCNCVCIVMSKACYFHANLWLAALWLHPFSLWFISFLSDCTVTQWLLCFSQYQAIYPVTC